MKDDSLFGPILALLTVAAVGVVIGLVVFVLSTLIGNYVDTPGHLATIEALRRDVRYYEQVEKCIPAKVIADVQGWNKIIMANHDQAKIRVVPKTWGGIDPIVTTPNIKLCN